MMLAADRLAQGIAKPRLGTVSGYDPGTYMVKVQLQPEGIETGWLPLGSPGVGNGFGIFAGPGIGDQVEVQFPDGDLSSGVVSMRFYSDVARPVSVPSGEVWIVHQSGSFLKFHNDGSIEFKAAAGASYTATGHAFHGPVTMDQTLQVTQTIIAGGNISDQNGAKGTVQKIRDQYDTHTHGGVQTGSGNTSTPSNSL
jgi:phage gp45-like